MTGNTRIQWATHTFNPWRGCQKVAVGCANCYAEKQSKRNPGTLGIWGPNGTRVVASESMWRQPLKWNAAARAAFEDYVAWERDKPERPRVFCASFADVFEDWIGGLSNSQGREMWLRDCGHWVAGSDGCREGCGCDSSRPLTLDDVRARLFAMIDDTPNLDWLLLTKRPENILRMVPAYFPGGYIAEAGRMNQEGPRSNLWLGVSVACQEDAGRLIPELLKCRDLAAKLFVSVEPLVGPVDLTPWIGYNPLHETDTQRRSGVRGSQDGSSGDSPGRIGLAREVPPQESVGRAGDDIEGSTPGTSGRIMRGGLPIREGYDGWPANDVPSAQACLASPPRTNPGEPSDQPQEWQQGGQSPVESGAVQHIGEPGSRSQDWIGEPAGNSQQQQPLVPDGCRGHSDGLRGGTDNASRIGSEIRREPSSNLEDRSGRQDVGRTGTNSPISLVIVGGESGANARPCNVEWIESIVAQCRAAGVPCFIKQLGSRPILPCKGDWDAIQSQWPRHVLFDCPEDGEHKPIEVLLRDPKGGDPSEWPERLRVREVPS